LKAAGRATGGRRKSAARGPFAAWLRGKNSHRGLRWLGGACKYAREFGPTIGAREDPAGQRCRGRAQQDTGQDRIRPLRGRSKVPRFFGWHRGEARGEKFGFFGRRFFANLPGGGSWLGGLLCRKKGTASNGEDCVPTFTARPANTIKDSHSRRDSCRTRPPTRGEGRAKRKLAETGWATGARFSRPAIPFFSGVEAETGQAAQHIGGRHSPGVAPQISG